MAARTRRRWWWSRIWSNWLSQTATTKMSGEATARYVANVEGEGRYGSRRRRRQTLLLLCLCVRENAREKGEASIAVVAVVCVVVDLGRRRARRELTTMATVASTSTMIGFVAGEDGGGSAVDRGCKGERRERQRAERAQTVVQSTTVDCGDVVVVTTVVARQRQRFAAKNRERRWRWFWWICPDPNLDLDLSSGQSDGSRCWVGLSFFIRLQMSQIKCKTTSFYTSKNDVVFTRRKSCIRRIFRLSCSVIFPGARAYAKSDGH